MNDQWLSIVEYARTFAISDMTVRRRIKTGRIHAVLREGKYFIPVDIDADGRPTRQRDRAASGAEAPRSAAGGPVVAPSWTAAATSTLPRNHGNQGAATAPMRHSVGLGTHNSTSSSALNSPIPSVIQRPLEGARNVAVDGSQLLSFCQETLRRVADTERSLRSEHEARHQALSSELHARSLEMQNLRQQIEDMQVLLNMLENRR